MHDFSALFTAIPASRALAGVSTVSGAKWAGPIADMISSAGAPRAVVLHLLRRSPQWDVLWRADYGDGRAMFGIFDPSAFVALANLDAKIVVDTPIVYSSSPADPGANADTVILTASCQPARVMLKDGRFLIAPIYFRTAPPKPISKIPAFLR